MSETEILMLRFPEHLFARFKEMSNLLKQSPRKQELQQKLTETRQAMERETLGVAEGFRQYGSIVSAYYAKFHPFGTRKLQNDFEDFVELIGHSVVVGNYSVISHWGVDYPLDNRGVLAEDPQKYLPVFQAVVTDRWQYYKEKYGWSESAKLYWQYLINEWQRKL